MPYNAPEESPYDPSVPDYDPETLPLDEILLEAMDRHTLQLRVCMPAQITNVGGNQQVDVQPMLQEMYLDNDAPTPLPIIKNVPVCMPMGSNYSIKLPLANGDNGLLVFCDRSLDAWTASTGQNPVDPADTRQHNLTDPIFFPGLVPFANQTTDQTTDLIVTAGTASLHLQNAGTYLFKGAGSQELMDLLDQALSNLGNLCGDLGSAIGDTVQGLNAIATASTTGANGGGPVVFATPFATALISPLASLNSLQTTVSQLQSTVQQLQQNLDALKGQ